MNPMISYAQNLEDVILWRALKSVHKGFYVDVGANDPELDSVTKWFYDQGWQGINVEPSFYWSSRLNAQRHRDINVPVAVSDASEEMCFYEVLETGLSTLDESIAERYRNDRSYRVEEKQVPVWTLTQVLDTYLPSGTNDIHFLKVDVEGLETAVIRGLDFACYKPWVMLVESTLPLSQRRSDHDWSVVLKSAGYVEAYFDGLNSFYLSKQHLDLLPAFGQPPNVFDGYVSSKVVALERALDESRRWGLTLDARVNALESELIQRNQRVLHLQAQHEALGKGLLFSLLICGRHGLQNLLIWVRHQQQLLSEQGWRGRVRRLMRKLQRILAALPRSGDSYQAKELVWPVKAPVSKTATAISISPEVFPRCPTPPEFRDHFLAKLRDTDVSYRFFGHVSGHYSLSVVNRALAVALESACPGRVTFKPYHGGVVEQVVDLPEGQRAIIEALIERGRSSSSEGRDHGFTVSIAHHYPLVADPEPADLRLAMFFWEESRVPWETIVALQDQFDGLLVASHFVKTVLRNSGCFLPVFVIPLGVDQVLTGVSPDVMPVRSGASGDSFTFLHVSSCFPRKGVDVLLRAYFDAYTGADNVVLHIKTFRNCHNQVREQVAVCVQASKNPPRVVVDESEISDAEMQALYERANVVVLPTRGEGFNLPAAESLALGIPLIVTGHGAQLDFASLNHAMLIPYQFAQSQSHVQTGESCWAEPDVKMLVRLMRAVEADVRRDAAGLNDRLKKAKSHVKEVYQWGRSADGVRWAVAALRQRLGSAAQPRVALISSWDCRCGIAEYARHLVEGLSKDFSVEVYCDDRTLTSTTDVTVAWSIDATDSVASLLSEADFTRYDVVLIQHQPALFSLSKSLCESLAVLNDAGVTVVLELHATKPLVTSLAAEPGALSSLRRISRLVVHSVSGLNDLLQLGLADNVMLLPHGVSSQAQPESGGHYDFRPAMGLTEQDLLLGTFGFALPHKGVDQLVAALPGLSRRLGCRVGLLALTACLDERSEAAIQAWRSLAEEMGVADRIQWVTEYQPEATCLSMLAVCDLLVFPYHETGDSASGAVTVGLASMRPVIVSDAAVFSDWQDCTIRMKGCSVGDIEDAVVRCRHETRMLKALEARQRNWLEMRSWDRVSARLSGLLRGLRLDLLYASEKHRNVARGPRQLLVDVSTLYANDGGSGVQRVVRSILAVLDADPPSGFLIRPIHFCDDGQYRYTASLTPANAELVLWDEKGVDFAEGDVFLGLDLTAHLFPVSQSVLQHMREKGVSLAFVLHDILPVTHPHWFPPGMADVFSRWLHGLADTAHYVVAVSNHSAQELQRWIASNHPASELQIRTFRLGMDFEAAPASKGLPAGFAQVLPQLVDRPTLLAVGTVEIRKGYDDLLQAMDILWAEGLAINLLIVGKPGWSVDALISRLMSHTQRGSQLFWLDEASDECLQRCYEVGDLLVAASYDEGFGLPLVEAAARHLPVVARDISVFHEVLGEYATYFSGGPAELALGIKRLLASGMDEQLASSAYPRLLTWSESKNLLLSAIGFRSA